MYLLITYFLLLILVFRYFKKILKLIQSFRAIKYLHLDQSINQYLNRKMVKKKVIDFSKFKYEPVKYESCAIVYERIKNRLVEKQLEQTELFANLQMIFDGIPRILKQAEQSSCLQIKANGYYAYVKVIYRFFECIDEQFRLDKTGVTERKDLEFFTKASHLLFRLTEIQLELARLTNLEDEESAKNLEIELEKYPEFHKHLKMFREIKLKREQLNGLNNNNSSSNTDLDSFNSLPLFTPNLDFILESLVEAIEQPNTKGKKKKSY